MRAPRPPLITDAEALEVVNAALDQRSINQLRSASARGMSKQELLTAIESEAITAAEGGNFRPLADLVRRGAKKARPGPSRRAVAARSKNFWAALELPAIAAVLREHYPAVRVTRELAIVIAAMRWDIDENTFRNFLRSRHRPYLQNRGE
jgi:hypothetical protein